MPDNQPISIKQATQLLLESLNSETPEDDARYLLSFVTNKSFTWLRTWPDEIISKEQVLLLHQVIQRRQQGEPVAYITGERDFWTLTLKTNQSTLIPRSETELLVELALKFLAAREQQHPKQKVLDLGTGTGAIALAIASERVQDKLVAVDFQPQAVALAIENAKFNAINNIEIIQSDWFASVTQNDFDLIVSNPPYIEDNDPHLSRGDLVFEPKSALVAEGNGLADILTIVKQAKSHLIPQGQLMLEHGYQQADAVRKIMLENGFENIQTVQDLAGLDRVTLASR